jgi:hypothetical protein
MLTRFYKPEELRSLVVNENFNMALHKELYKSVLEEITKDDALNNMDAVLQRSAERIHSSESLITVTRISELLDPKDGPVTPFINRFSDCVELCVNRIDLINNVDVGLNSYKMLGEAGYTSLKQ